MKVSCFKKYPGYNSEIGSTVFYDVFCDGNKIESCFFANTVDGIAWGHKVDKNGCYVLNKNRDAVLEKLYIGKISVKEKNPNKK